MWAMCSVVPHAGFGVEQPSIMDGEIPLLTIPSTAGVKVGYRLPTIYVSVWFLIVSRGSCVAMEP